MKKKILFCTFFAIGFNLIFIAPALAIPSPDVVVGLFASVSQIFVLLTAVLGGVGLAKGRSLGKAARQSKKANSLQKGFFYAVLILLLLSAGFNILQYAHRVDARNTRLQANLTRSSVEQGERVGDTSLKTLSFSEQLDHPRGISTQKLAQKLAQREKSKGSEFNLIDVREPEEVETAWLEGAEYIPYPSVLRNSSRAVQKGEETILLCHSGNRSSELCNKLAKRGIPCKFVIGGTEKWLSENRPIETPKGQSVKELRDIPNYRNKNVLLDTPKVRQLVDKENALFIDVRYPGDFELGHLPNAVNIPLRKLTQEEWLARIKALPKNRPAIAACYDRRSCFYSTILGLRLHREGYDFRGRYTVPHEYIAPKAGKAHVAQWSNNRTLLGMASYPLQSLLRGLERHVGHLALAILLLVILLRLVTFPLTIKGERDRVVLKHLSEEIRQLKEKHANNPSRASRAILSLYRKHRLTPSFNLIGTLIQVTILLLAFRAITRVAQNSQDGLFWMPQLSAPDPLLLLPLVVGVLTILQLYLNAQKPLKKLQSFYYFLGGSLLFFITFRLPAAANLYLVLSLGLLLVQNQIFQYILKRHNSSQSNVSTRPIPPTDVVPLQLSHRVPGAGTKAVRLAQLMEAGLPVPDGFVITYTLLARSKSKLKLSAEDWQQLDRHWRKLNATKVAVRSSGASEDGVEQSYAGMFESVLNVTWENFHYALEEVYLSRKSDRVNSYNNDSSASRGGILVQEMVDAEFAGVLFTQHPAEPSSLLVEVISGLAENLVSGKVTPKAYRFGRLSAQSLDAEAPPIDLAPLIALGQQVEELFGSPQDIEWAYRQGQFFLLQARNITAPLAGVEGKTDRETLFEQEKQRLLHIAADAQPGEILFAQNELSELLPQPTPLSLSFMESLWQAGGTTEIACDLLGLPYDVEEKAPTFVTSVFGRLYVNRLEEQRRMSRSAGAIASFRLIRTADRLEADYRQDFLPDFLHQIRLHEALDFSQFSTHELFDLFEKWRQNFTQNTYVQAHLINIAADFSLKLAERELKRHKLNPATYLSQIPETVVHQALSLLPEIRAGKRPVSDFLAQFGHRSSYDFELAQPRYNEDPQLVEQLLSTAALPSLKTHAAVPPLPPSKVLGVALKRAQRFQSLKEEAKHHALREFALLRRLLVELDRRLELGNGIFYYSLDELSQLRDRADLQKTVERKARYDAMAKLFKKLRLPSQITLRQLESLSLNSDRALKVSDRSGEGLHGTLVAGQAPVEGRAQVILDVEEIHNFQPGNILVTRFTHPSWTPIFPLATAAVAEVGGWLSHAAIVAREYNVPTIVGVRGAIDEIETGDWLKLYPDGRIEQVRASDSATCRSA
ncbi:YidC/Oxa1 family membrane protein insertase [Lusitaniella coriacea LEGE 07157]|uniref:YidC/Oxa1 family membrane protein insertase n=1 Tax=Lusitaniella coriacea LEGE 07157 TaxID=945747 RepID=A0A8J7IXM0_9CYAN|nr:PEP/pyruvate-binding domain-containing protein [Lusitaniella coriacea]MBE9118858.1 YidC/Oxa1 family membrane protein insertase [Lusitaniella coriacea LEGE 07157]